MEISIQEQVSALRERVSQDETEFGKRTNILLDEILVLQAENSSFDKKLDSLTERMDSLTERVDSLAYSQQQLTATVTSLSGLMMELAQRNIALAQRDNELAQRSAEDRAEIRRIWEYLQLQQRNQGNGQG